MLVHLGDGTDRLLVLEGKSHSLLLPDTPRDTSATVTVQGVSDEGKAGPASSKRLAASDERDPKPKKAPTVGDLGVAEVIFGVG